MSTTNLSPLRQRMIEDMSLRNLAPRTQEAYIRGCRKLAAFRGIADLDGHGASSHKIAPLDFRFSFETDA